MADFKWEMQERIDRGMNPDEAYNATRDAYAAIWDNRDKLLACPYCPFHARTQSQYETHMLAHSVVPFYCDPDESGGVRDDDDASAGGA